MCPLVKCTNCAAEYCVRISERIRENTNMATSVNVNQRLLENVRDEPKKMLTPIFGYEKVTVKSLDDACESIQHLFDETLQQYIIVAKMNSTEPEDELSPDESASIQLYTIEWNVHDDSLYTILNRTLRLADRTKLQPWFKYLKLLLTAFFKLPPSKQTLVWRGVREDLSALYPKGKEFAWWAFSSCTASISVLECPSYLGKSGTRTIFSIQTNRGKHIRAHSYFENEDEILLPPGIYFRVIDSLNPAEGLHIIHLEEISPPFQTLAEPFDLSQLKQVLPQTKSPTVSEIYSTASVTSEPSIQPSSAKNKPQPITSTKKSVYSTKKLDCGGRACAKCGHCRDWYWRADSYGNKDYKKRASAICYNNYYCYRDGYFHGYPVYNFDDYPHRSDIYSLCECSDNHF